MHKKIYNILGLAQKAGNTASGGLQLSNALKRNKIRLLIIAEDTVAKNKEMLTKMAANNNTRVLTFGVKDDLGLAIGKAPRSAVGITDRNFAAMIEKAFADLNNENIE